MWDNILYDGMAVIVVAWLGLLAAVFALARAPQRPAGPMPGAAGLEGAWREPSPVAAQALLKKAGREEDFLREMFLAIAAEYAGRQAEGIKRIRCEA